MNKDQIRTLLEGSYDLHIHPLPSHFPRSLDDFELVEQAAAHGMAGVMIKSHYDPTSARAALVNRKLAHLSARAYGGIALNWPVGGLNPYAVEAALQMGGRMVWMPTRDAANCLIHGDMPGDFFSRPGIGAMDGDGQLLPVIYDIFDVVKKYNAVLGTGHLSLAESVALCNAGIEAGVRMSLTHPEWARTIVPCEIQVELAQKGVVIEKCWLSIAEGTVTAAQMASHIRAAGAEHCFLTTDRGQAGAESPVEGYLNLLEALSQEGLTHRELELMAKVVPARLVAG